MKETRRKQTRRKQTRRKQTRRNLKRTPNYKRRFGRKTRRTTYKRKRQKAAAYHSEFDAEAVRKAAAYHSEFDAEAVRLIDGGTSQTYAQLAAAAAKKAAAVKKAAAAEKAFKGDGGGELTEEVKKVAKIAKIAKEKHPELSYVGSIYKGTLESVENISDLDLTEYFIGNDNATPPPGLSKRIYYVFRETGETGTESEDFIYFDESVLKER